METQKNIATSMLYVWHVHDNPSYRHILTLLFHHKNIVSAEVKG